MIRQACTPTATGSNLFVGLRGRGEKSCIVYSLKGERLASIILLLLYCFFCCTAFAVNVIDVRSRCCRRYRYARTPAWWTDALLRLAGREAGRALRASLHPPSLGTHLVHHAREQRLRVRERHERRCAPAPLVPGCQRFADERARRLNGGRSRSLFYLSEVNSEVILTGRGGEGREGG